MKTTKQRIILAATVVLFATLKVNAYFDPTIGSWASRDPIGERGGKNLYGFAANNPVITFDRLGLDYQIVNLSPTGWWGVTLADVDVPGGLTWKGFHSRYLPTDGRNGHLPCPCKKENIILVQVVHEPWHGGRLQFDVGRPGFLPPHGPNDPIPGYYWDSRPADPLTIVDAPNTSGASGTWAFEDCAVCRTHPDGNTLDQVLGCVKFKFHRINDNSAELSVEGGNWGGLGFANAQSPGELWAKALANWRTTGR